MADRPAMARLRRKLEGGTTSRDAVRTVDHLDRLVTGLLNRARIDSGTRPLEMTPLRLYLQVERVVEELPPRGAPVTMRTEPTVVLGDPDLLAQAVRYLVENALRHGIQADGPSTVEATVAEGRVAVRDHGPGIDVGDREAIFGDRVTGGRGGIGVGLPIVRWVAELHGGRAHVASTPGPGALVELVLPRFIVR
jgi:signal transduction histidine kinase